MPDTTMLEQEAISTVPSARKQNSHQFKEITFIFDRCKCPMFILTDLLYFLNNNELLIKDSTKNSIDHIIFMLIRTNHYLKKKEKNPPENRYSTLVYVFFRLTLTKNTRQVKMTI